MKKITLSFMALAFMAGLSTLTSCGGGQVPMAENNTEVLPAATEQPAQAPAGFDGKALFEAKCQVCHQATGVGVPNAFPPLAKSDYLNDKVASIKASIKGLSGEITVNGAKYNSVMAPVPMNDEEILAVMNYVYSSWGNTGSVTLEDIAAAKK